MPWFHDRSQDTEHTKRSFKLIRSGDKCWSNNNEWPLNSPLHCILVNSLQSEFYLVFLLMVRFIFYFLLWYYFLLVLFYESITYLQFEWIYLPMWSIFCTQCIHWYWPEHCGLSTCTVRRTVNMIFSIQIVCTFSFYEYKGRISHSMHYYPLRVIILCIFWSFVFASNFELLSDVCTFVDALLTETILTWTLLRWTWYATMFVK